MELKKAIEEIKADPKKRKFVQSIDLIINFQKLDLKKPENKLNITLNLPKGKGKKTKVAVFSGNELIVEAKKVADKVITAEDLDRLSKNKAEAKKIAKEYDVFLAQTDLMASVGKLMGQVLGTRGKMPRPVPPTAKLEPIIKSLSNSVTIRTKTAPTAQVLIGTEEMSSEDIEANASAVINTVKEKLPNKEGNIKSILIKTTMGKPLKIDVK
ncbi:MAG: 50S ribosomal protein L1 [archaeon]